MPASVLESDVLPARLPRYGPADLDARCTTGEVVWVGAGALGSGDGRVRLVFRDQVETLVPLPDASSGHAEDEEDVLDGPVHKAIRSHLADRGA